MPERREHNLVVVNPGHFHAALTLRKHHPLLADEVYIYAEDGPDLKDFLHLVDSFNRRKSEPTSWRLQLFRGKDYLEALLRERAGDVAIVAGKNDTKLAIMRQLHRAGLHVLGDKSWLIDSSQLDLVREITASPPLAMDIMTERYEIANRLQQALSKHEEVFGGFRSAGEEPAVYLKSVHHLYKEVNGEPLVRPAWYFDYDVLGQGITDVTTHLVDLAQWMVAGEQGADYHRDIVLMAARQWPTDMPLQIFSGITGLDAFPQYARQHVSNGMLHYLCNANIKYTLRGVPVEIESIWDLAIPQGGGDTHYGILRGNRADLVVDQGPDTGFDPRLRVVPAARTTAYEKTLRAALAQLAEMCPGIGCKNDGNGYQITIPVALHHGHEARFANVLDQFLRYADTGTWPRRIGEELVAKYTLLADAYDLSHC
jgi:predicted dehydrogenase